jgi:hypothetical protein
MYIRIVKLVNISKMYCCGFTIDVGMKPVGSFVIVTFLL